MRFLILTAALTLPAAAFAQTSGGAVATQAPSASPPATGTMDREPAPFATGTPSPHRRTRPGSSTAGNAAEPTTVHTEATGTVRNEGGAVAPK